MGVAQENDKQFPPQGMLILMPGMLMVGQATSSLVLYLGLTLFSFGKSMSHDVTHAYCERIYVFEESNKNRLVTLKYFISATCSVYTKKLQLTPVKN